MSVQRTSSASGTDWARLRDLPDDEIVADDVPYDPLDPEAVAAFWSSAQVSIPTATDPALARSSDPAGMVAQDAVAVTLRLSPQVVRYFRGTGQGWQNRIDDALKEWIRGR